MTATVSALPIPHEYPLFLSMPTASCCKPRGFLWKHAYVCSEGWYAGELVPWKHPSSSSVMVFHRSPELSSFPIAIACSLMHSEMAFFLHFTSSFLSRYFQGSLPHLATCTQTFASWTASEGTKTMAVAPGNRPREHVFRVVLAVVWQQTPYCWWERMFCRAVSSQLHLPIMKMEC